MPKTSLDLTGKWQFKEYPLQARRMRNLDSADWLQTSVPCSIFNSLIEAGQIQRFELNTHPENFSWVSEKPWIYRKIFDVPAKLLNCDQVDLVFDGLDTIASIWLNGKLIGKANNMFIPFRFDVTQTLKLRNNSLLVKFEPAIHSAKKLMNRYTTFTESDFPNPHRVYIRKAQYQFGWDFCPALPGCGIWRPLRLEGTKEAKLAEVHIRTIDCNPNYADVKITAKLKTLKRKEFLCKVNLSCAEQTIEHNLTFTPGEVSQSTVIRIERPYLWWPAGYGQQHLYQLDCQLLSGDEVIAQTQKKIGVRMVKLNRSPDKHGEKFQFEINGQSIFAKGANWIPASILAGSLTSNDYQKLLHAAADANINMLRVWGGGYYETKEFYELCDQLGIMVWQDFMFACAYYADQQWFLTEVINEATTIIKQLRNHPCLVIWCGNNEIDWMHRTGKLGKGKKFYGKTIYHQLLPQLVTELDPDRDYIPTTPIAADNNPNDPNSGTIHQWDIWSGHQPVRQYLCQPQNIPRFVTEFGLQSLPHIKTIKNFCPIEQLRIGSFPIEKHNYQLDGNSRLYRYVGDLFGTAENLEQLVYLSQITQARALKTYVEHLRAHNFRNSGVLFWQFNDCCPAISWSAIDSTYEPKAIYYYAKRFFSNLLIAVVTEWKKPKASSLPTLQPLNVTVINDSNQPVTATLSCRLIDLFANLLDQVAIPFAIAPFSISALPKLPKEITSPAHPEKSCLHLLMEQNGKKIAENLFLYLPDKYIDWPELKINKRLLQITQKQWRLKLKSNAVAKDVQISTSVPAQFSDNFIDLIPPDDYEITINSEQPISTIEPLLQMRSLKCVFKTNH
ncbi:MAG: sugar-binding domain-containing protein [Sedimentisphaerales bacterium]